MSEFPICVVTYDRGNRPDRMLAEVAARLGRAGVRVGGLLQEEKVDTGSNCATLHLEDIATGRRVQIFENRGAGTRGCKLDPAGLAEAAGWLRAAVDARPDILFVNRFGRQEAEGRGLADEIGAAVASGIPVVIAVGEALLAAWDDFAGDGATVLAVEGAALEAWCLEQARAAVG